MLKQIKICLSENTSRRHDLIVHITVQRARRSFVRLLKKREILQMKNPHLCRKPQMEVHKLVMISHHRPFEEEVGALKGVLHRGRPNKYPYTPLQLLAASLEMRGSGN